MMDLSGLRNRKQALKVVKELDAFPKVPDSYQETTASGGGVSILVFVIIAILVISEIRYYTDTDLLYDYEVDSEFNGKLSINVDITVAMKCHQIGADVLDLTGESVSSFGKLKEEDVYFDLSEKQRRHVESVRSVNGYIKSEYHSIHKFLWQSGYGDFHSSMPEREDGREGPTNACRLSGSLEVNKVAGNFHITAGKSVPVIPRGHAHLAMMVKESDYNFSHRIEKFSFGEKVPGRINPLDGEEKLTDINYHMYHYFMQVVPTHVKTRFADINTYQYAVTERNRTISHSKGSHGVPGIFVRYDLSPMKVRVVETHKPYAQFLVRLCGIVGGIFATSGILHSLAGFLVDLVCCRLNLGKYGFQSQAAASRHTPSPVTASSYSNSPSPQPNSSLPLASLHENTNGGLMSQNTPQTLDLLTGGGDVAASLKGSLLAQDSFVREDSVS